MCFDFRRARSHPLGPTITSRLTGLVGNVHAGMSACQGAIINAEQHKRTQLRLMVCIIIACFAFHPRLRHRSLPTRRRCVVSIPWHNINSR